MCYFVVTGPFFSRPYHMQQGIQNFLYSISRFIFEARLYFSARAASVSFIVKDDDTQTFTFDSLGVLFPSCVYHVSIMWLCCVHLRSEPGIYFLLFNMAAVRSSYAYSVFARIIRRELPATFLHEDDQVV